MCWQHISGLEGGDSQLNLQKQQCSHSNSCPGRPDPLSHSRSVTPACFSLSGWNAANRRPYLYSCRIFLRALTLSRTLKMRHKLFSHHIKLVNSHEFNLHSEHRLNTEHSSGPPCPLSHRQTPQLLKKISQQSTGFYFIFRAAALKATCSITEESHTKVFLLSVLDQFYFGPSQTFTIHGCCSLYSQCRILTTVLSSCLVSGPADHSKG